MSALTQFRSWLHESNASMDLTDSMALFLLFPDLDVLCAQNSRMDFTHIALETVVAYHQRSNLGQHTDKQIDAYERTYLERYIHR